MDNPLLWVWIVVVFAAAVFLINVWDARSLRRDGYPVSMWRLVASGLLLLAIFPYAVWETISELFLP
ncbi:hypothetical protein E0H26_07350 [Micromonospora zingiberis]|uniref:Uncharacterized protein n=1 Tax=Micromonospora zingiberis TaxID=2053011 RepID=A0A4R0GQW5_9ACTN|nr:hypothetical protein [Micromonospora zingiberis]TCB99202.1 hypothetical protein E0H26_07350 [Micromonospora zingiberis]